MSIYLKRQEKIYKVVFRSDWQQIVERSVLLAILRNTTFKTPVFPRSNDNEMFLLHFVPQGPLSKYWTLTKQKNCELTAQKIHDLGLILAFITVYIKLYLSLFNMQRFNFFLVKPLLFLLRLFFFQCIIRI